VNLNESINALIKNISFNVAIILEQIADGLKLLRLSDGILGSQKYKTEVSAKGLYCSELLASVAGF
jgi:hypothetical protein